MSIYTQRRQFGLDPMETHSGGSLPSTTGGVQLDPIETHSGGSLPPTSRFGLSPVESTSGGSLPSSEGSASIYDMFFGAS